MNLGREHRGNAATAGERGVLAALVVAILLVAPTCASDGPTESGPLPAMGQLALSEYRDRLEGGWAMEMAGYAWSDPTEFRFQGTIIPESAVPEWQPELINKAFGDDNFYAQGPYFTALIEHGPFATTEQMGENFAKLQGQLWHANAAAFANLGMGLSAPESGHYSRNPHSEDIDWLCCGSGFIGLITPGQPKAALDLAFRAGHVVGYGDGVYPGVVASVMISSAYSAAEPEEIVYAGLDAAPIGSKTRAILEDVVAWHAEDPDDWTRTWQRLHDKWEIGPERGRCPDEATSPSFSTSARLHLAYDVMGLLYGHGDLEESMRVAMRSGQDSDCTTHTVGEVLGTFIGFSSIDEKWTAGLDRTVMLKGTSYTFDQVINHSISAARAIVRARGGTITGEGTDSEAWTLPRELVAPPLLEVWPEDMNAVPQLEVHAVHEGARDFTFSVDVTDADGLGEVEWYFGDLSHAKGASVSHRFAATGSYEVLVFASDRTGNSMGKRLDVEVD